VTSGTRSPCSVTRTRIRFVSVHTHRPSVHHPIPIPRSSCSVTASR
jgi:hypothetical protein